MEPVSNRSTMPLRMQRALILVMFVFAIRHCSPVLDAKFHYHRIQKVPVFYRPVGTAALASLVPMVKASAVCARFHLPVQRATT